jgi:hypothetical protein
VQRFGLWVRFHVHVHGHVHVQILASSLSICRSNFLQPLHETNTLGT